MGAFVHQLSTTSCGGQTMASVRKRGDKYQARVHRRGFPTLARTFLTQREALQWARKAEVDVEKISIRGGYARTTVRDLVTRYATEVTPKKKGARSERLRLRAWAQSPFGAMRVDEIRPPLLAKWRDDRLASGRAGSTVRNDLNTLSAVYRHAASEWGYDGLANPVASLRRPALNLGRSRRVSDEELSSVKHLTRSTDLPPIIDLAVETAMRLSELLSLTPSHIDLAERTAILSDTKNGSRRIVPLSPKAIDTLTPLLRRSHDDALRLFSITPHAVTTAFRRASRRVHVKSYGKLGRDLRFHDLRHEAISRLFEQGLNPIEVAAVSGHRSMQMLARYTHFNIKTIVQRLASPTVS